MATLIQQFYDVERAGAKPWPDANRDLRQAQSMPLLSEIAAERDALATPCSRNPAGRCVRLSDQSIDRPAGLSTMGGSN
jgi:hypothetical protein